MQACVVPCETHKFWPHMYIHQDCNGRRRIPGVSVNIAGRHNVAYQQELYVNVYARCTSVTVYVVV